MSADWDNTFWKSYNIPDTECTVLVALQTAALCTSYLHFIAKPATNLVPSLLCSFSFSFHRSYIVVCNSHELSVEDNIFDCPVWTSRNLFPFGRGCGGRVGTTGLWKHVSENSGFRDLCPPLFSLSPAPSCSPIFACLSIMHEWMNNLFKTLFF